MLIYIHKFVKIGGNMVSRIFSMGLNGIEGFKVKIECDVSTGLPLCDIVGLPDTAVKEAKNRVRSAITNCGFKFPLARITVNLAPASIKKSGSLYDLPILLAILKASNQIECDLSDSIFIGELSLSGELSPVSGALSMTEHAKKNGFKNIFIPYENALESSLIEGINVYPVKNVSELIDFILGNSTIKAFPKVNVVKNKIDSLLDFAYVKGQYEAKRALEIAVAGGHNILMIGSPGSGKSMLAKNIVSIIPDLTFDEMLQTTAIYSVAGMVEKDVPLMSPIPFRAPHYSISTAGLLGGGTFPNPGEISLAHNGILFLDELPEFSRNTLEALRQPLEDGYVTISRVRNSVTFPCSIMLIAAMNPCPCGYYGHPKNLCSCSARSIQRYMSRISGPILDRIDIHIEVPPVDFNQLNSTEKSEDSSEIRKRVNKAKNIQYERNKEFKIFYNSKVSSSMLSKICNVSDSSKKLLENAFNRLSLSARTYDKILKVSRTIADLEGSDTIEPYHVSEAIQFRNLDKKYFSSFS